MSGIRLLSFFSLLSKLLTLHHVIYGHSHKIIRWGGGCGQKLGGERGMILFFSTVTRGWGRYFLFNVTGGRDLFQVMEWSGGS